MPEPLAPGVHVEDAPFRVESIEGVGTSTAGFVGPCRYGPVTQTPGIIASFAEFVRLHGDGSALSFGGGAGDRANYLWFAARAFFGEGGQRLCIGRLFRRNDDVAGSPRPCVPPPAKFADEAAYDGAALVNGRCNDGHARASVPGAGGRDTGLLVRARYPGAAGNLRVQLAFFVGPNVLSGSGTGPRVADLAHGDVVLLDTFAAEPASGQLHAAAFDAAARAWSFAPLGGGPAVPLSALRPDGAPPAGRDRLRIVSMAVTVAPMDASRPPELWPGLSPNPTHTHTPSGRPDSLFSVFQPLAADAPQAGPAGHRDPAGRRAHQRRRARDPARSGRRRAPGRPGGARQPGRPRPAQPRQHAGAGAARPRCRPCAAHDGGPPGRRLWGARTISADPAWKYVNVRRYVAYLERSIDKGTQWVVFEPNGEPLWAHVRRTIEDFLIREWQSGALQGDSPDKAYFMHCDRSTMTQDDLDHGRLVGHVGVAPLKPAEFVVFRIGRWTADGKP